MADIVNRETRSRMMSGIRGRDTKPELMLRKALHARGLRYRLHDKNLPGKPDLVFSRFSAVVFVHGCFWHRHVGCKYATNPKSRIEFWKAKFEANVERDRNCIEALQKADWRVGIVWECQVKSDLSAVAGKVEEWLAGETVSLGR